MPNRYGNDAVREASLDDVGLSQLAAISDVLLPARGREPPPHEDTVGPRGLVVGSADFQYELVTNLRGKPPELTLICDDNGFTPDGEPNGERFGPQDEVRIRKKSFQDFHRRRIDQFSVEVMVLAEDTEPPLITETCELGHHPDFALVCCHDQIGEHPLGLEDRELPPDRSDRLTQVAHTTLIDRQTAEVVASYASDFVAPLAHEVGQPFHLWNVASAPATGNDEDEGSFAGESQSKQRTQRP